MKLNLLKKTFAGVYGQSYSPTNYTGPQYTQTLSPNANDVYVHDCVFSYCSSSSNGGALFCSSSVYRLLIEQTTFISCSTSGSYGGGIYFLSTTYGECVLSRICGFNCSAKSTSHFAYVEIKNNVNNKNHFNDSTITHTSVQTGNYPMRINCGSILCPSINITNNLCEAFPALYSNPTGGVSSETSHISCSSIVNNTANGDWGCMALSGSTTSQRIDTCNIINNNQMTLSSLQIIVHASSNLLIKDSCLLGNNKGMKVFYTTSTGKITLSHCTNDNSAYTGSVIFSAMSEETFIHALSHIVTQKCDSNFDSYGTLTVKPIVPSPSTHNLCSRYLISCNFKNPIIDPLRIMEFIFLLVFLPLDPANDYYFNSNCYLHVGFKNN
jgi:hypothetical protein